MRGENGVAVKKSSTKKTIEDVKSINKNNNKKSLDNKKVSRTIRKKVKCELTSENIDLFHEGKHYGENFFQYPKKIFASSPIL